MNIQGILTLVLVTLTLQVFGQDTLQKVAPVSAMSDTLSLKKLKSYKVLSSALKNPKQVQKLDLSRQKLKEFPIEILQLNELRVLILAGNKIKSIPPEIGTLTKLEWLDLSNNKITELPKEISNLKNLKVIHINRNELITVPPEISQLERLELLDLWSNEIDSLPSEIGTMTNLKELDLRGILIDDPEMVKIKSQVPPTTKVRMSPSCNCKY